MKFLLLAAIVGIALVNAQPVQNAVDTTTIGTIKVYNVSECVSEGLGLLSDHTYQLPSTKCVNTPPNVDLPSLPFLSYRGEVTPPPGERCFFDVFAGEGCTDNFVGFQTSASNSDTCQEVSVATTGNELTIGAKSAKLVCYTPT